MLEHYRLNLDSIIRTEASDNKKLNGRLFTVKFSDPQLNRSSVVKALLTEQFETDAKEYILTETKYPFNEKDGIAQRNIIDNLFLQKLFAGLYERRNSDFAQAGLFEILPPAMNEPPTDNKLDEWSQADILHHPGGFNCYKT